MIIGVQGTRNFNDYNIFLRAMGTALTMLEDGDNEFLIYGAGPSNINDMALEFSNVSQRGLKARGIKIRMQRIPVKVLKENIRELDYLLYFSKPKEPVSDVVDLAEAKDIEVGIYRY